MSAGGHTIEAIVEAMGDALDRGDGSAAACDVLDRMFIDAELEPWLPNRKLRADIRGLIVAAYRLGRARGLRLEVK